MAMSVRLLWALPLLAAASMPTIQQYHIHELVIEGKAFGNPFMEEIDASFTLDGTTMTVPGFYDGNLQWKVRFSPPTVGVYSWKTVGTNPSLTGHEGSLECTANTDHNVHGGLEVYDNFHFRFADGTPHMLMGYEADWLWALGLNGTKSKLKLDDFVGKVVNAGGFNHWLINVYAKEASWASGVPSPPKVSPTQHTPWEGGVDSVNVQGHLGKGTRNGKGGNSRYFQWKILNTCAASKVKKNLDCKDEDLTNGHHKTNATDECCTLCAARDDCATWTLYPGRSDCYLKSGCSTPVSKSDCLSGGNTAPSPSPPSPSPPSPSPSPSPDQSRMDLGFWAHWDEVMKVLAAHGAVAHVYVMVENKAVKWPAQRSAEDDLYWRYTFARLQAYNNVVFDLSKEANNLPDAYVIDRLKFARQLNGHKRLITVHTGHDVYKKLCDFVTDQTHGNYHSTILKHRASYGTPVFNSEFMYEAGPIKTYPPVHDVDLMRKTMWGIYMAGGYAAWYYADSAWDVIRDDITPGYGYCKHLRSFWESVNEWQYAPADNTVKGFGSTVYGRAIAGSDYLTYAPEGGTFSVTLAGVPQISPLVATWYDPTTGAYHEDGGAYTDGSHMFTTPSTIKVDAVLRLHVQKTDSLILAI